ncbi:MAG TPA: hypothetical protein VMB81_17680 [Candidatus Sulfotelmatobacter sp.]|nr:hypothetical protein [Candidatus Sulfotelmatobacter sp.]
MALLIGLASAEERPQPRHWAEGRWETQGGGQAGTLVITRSADGSFQVTETVKSDKWNDPRSLGRAAIEVEGDRLTITDDLGNIYKLQRAGPDELSGTFFILRYQTHMLKTRPVTYFRAE